MSGGVTVAQGPLEAFVLVRIQVGQPTTVAVSEVTRILEAIQKGDSKAGTVTTGVIVTGLLLLPIAPIGLLWGFKRGEDAFISAGRRYDVFTSGNSSVTPLPETSR